MKEKERLAEILRRKEPDRPACICPGGMMNMIVAELMDLAGVQWPQAHSDPALMAKLAAASYEQGCFENMGVPFCMTVEAEALGARIALGTKYIEPHVTDYAIDSAAQWEELQPAEFHKGRASVTLKAIALLKERNLDAPIVGNITGPVSTATSLMEPTVFYKELRKKNGDAHRLLDFVTEQLIIFANAQIKAGADIIAISDPSGTGEILGPGLFEEFAAFYINKALGCLIPQETATIVHICGQMRGVYQQVNQIKADILSFDSIVPMREARKNLPDRILMGNVSTYALEFGEPDKIAALTEFCRASKADILSPACGLGTKSPICNVRAMLETLKKGVPAHA